MGLIERGRRRVMAEEEGSAAARALGRWEDAHGLGPGAPPCIPAARRGRMRPGDGSTEAVHDDPTVPADDNNGGGGSGHQEKGETG